jgi:hypothetical protein
LFVGRDELGVVRRVDLPEGENRQPARACLECPHYRSGHPHSIPLLDVERLAVEPDLAAPFDDDVDLFRLLLVLVIKRLGDPPSA